MDTSKKLYSYISEYMGYGAKRNKNLDIEELFTLLLINKETNRDAIYEDLPDNLQNFIINLLEELSDVNGNKKSEYDIFVTNLQRADTVITYNWDVLLDNCLGRIKLLKDRAAWNGNQYTNFLHHLSGLSETTYSHATISPPFYSTNYPEDKGYYIKLHGSIDWLACSNSDCRAYGKIFPNLDSLKLAYCSECNEYVNTLIIPPVLNKQYRRYPSIRKLWSLATLELEYAKHIIIWGYSLPPTDFYSNWLFRQSNHWLEKIDIINPACVRSTKKKKFLNRQFIEKFRHVFAYPYLSADFAFYENYIDYAEGISINQKYGFRPL